MSNTSVSKIRGSFFSNKDFQTEIFKLKDGTEIEIRQPSVGQRKELVDKANTTIDQSTGQMKASLMEFYIWGVIYCTFDPESGENIFTEEDYDALSELPCNSFVDDIGEKVLTFLNINLGKSGKNSRKTRRNS